MSRSALSHWGMMKLEILIGGGTQEGKWIQQKCRKGNAKLGVPCLTHPPNKPITGFLVISLVSVPVNYNEGFTTERRWE